MRPTILLIEDNPDHQELFSDKLKTDYELVFSETPEAALKALQGHNIYLVVLDYMLRNNFNGLDLLKTIIMQDPFLPVIVITAYGDEDIAAEAIKAGAAEYIRKTPDNRFLIKLKTRIHEILNQRGTFTPQKMLSMTSFFISHKMQFLKLWKEKVIFYKEHIGSSSEIEVKDSIFDTLFTAFLGDLQRETATETLEFLIKMIWEKNTVINSLVLAELLNTSFKEAARELLVQEFPHTFDGRAQFMQQIGTLVDKNDLMLSCEYERIVSQSTETMMKATRINTKLLVMRTLQHEIRQPLSYIFNSTELLLEGDTEEKIKQTLTEILEKAKKIDALLSELEKDSEIPLKNYSDELPMYDLSLDKGN